ncbi:hypothetical protein P7K49_007308 [Saguinus oedipus]|uniref:Uncharacterized protein n=1 Tax=Saguinus oedipus TaxID=9490 RepID=A0ABQ9VUJ1_SAGOE|nr:hypothetical protein P7K49_007308 [Saguinus oedipus]
MEAHPAAAWVSGSRGLRFPGTSQAGRGSGRLAGGPAVPAFAPPRPLGGAAERAPAAHAAPAPSRARRPPLTLRTHRRRRPPLSAPVDLSRPSSCPQDVAQRRSDPARVHGHAADRPAADGVR